jgi:hypothetical protein
MVTSNSEAVLRLRDYGPILVTRDQGEPVRSALLQLLKEHETVFVDLDDVDAYTPSFMDEVLGKCLETVGAAQFRKQVRLTAAQSDVRKLVNLVLSNRSARNS